MDVSGVTARSLDCSGNIFTGRVLYVCDHDPRAFAREEFRGSRSDTGSRPRNDGYTAAENAQCTSSLESRWSGCLSKSYVVLAIAS
jgi:hypothetical protein